MIDPKKTASGAARHDLAEAAEYIAPHIGTWASGLGLTVADARFAQFHEDLISALRACIGTHNAPQTLNRVSHMRKHLEEIASAARDLAGQLRDFSSRYRFPTLVLRLGRTFDLVAPAEEPLREYLTRRQAAEYVRDERGRPMSFSTASKLAALGEFAPPAVWWGRRPLYARHDLRRWADARSRPTKEHAATETTTQGQADCCTAQQAKAAAR